MFCLFVARRFVAIKSEFSLASSFVFVFFCKLCTYLKIEYDKSDEYIIIYKPLLQDGGIDRECDKEWIFFENKGKVEGPNCNIVCFLFCSYAETSLRSTVIETKQTAEGSHKKR